MNLDYERIRRDWPLYVAAAKQFGISPHLLGAITSRETNTRDIAGDYVDGQAQGWGRCQVDIKSWAPFVHSTDRDGKALWQDPEASLFMGAYILSLALKEFPRNLRAGIARYNCSRAGVLASLLKTDGQDPDLRTTDKNYSKDVLRRMGELQAVIP